MTTGQDTDKLVERLQAELAEANESADKFCEQSLRDLGAATKMEEQLAEARAREEKAHRILTLPSESTAGPFPPIALSPEHISKALEYTITQIKEAAEALDAPAPDQPPEPLAEGREHLTVSGEFRSDKYPWCHDGFVPLKVTDGMAQDLLAEYARRRATVDAQFSRDLLQALAAPAPEECPHGCRGTGWIGAVNSWGDTAALPCPIHAAQQEPTPDEPPECPACNGTGEVIDSSHRNYQDCENCDGSGYASVEPTSDEEQDSLLGKEE